MTEDMEVLRKAGEAAQEMLAEDPALSKPEHRNLAKETNRLFARSLGN